MDSDNVQAVVQEKKKPTFAKSLKAPNVQEMVKKDPLQVPERYIRKQEEKPSNLEISHLSYMIPIIDFSLLSLGDEKELSRMDEACENWGFFQLINHTVPKEVMQNFKDASAEFFGLPIEEKEKFAMPADDIEGYGNAHVDSEDQRLNWSDFLLLVVYPSEHRKLLYWPTAPNKFKEIIEEYSGEIRKVGEDLLRSFSVIMGMEEDALIEMHEEVAQAIQINNYSACSRPDLVLGLKQHSDMTTISLLLQDDDLIGLQIKHAGEWVSVKPIPDALVINVGDIMEIWSNGKYKSIEHRVITNEKKARFSCASFLSPHYTVDIKPIEDTRNSQEFIKKYKKVNYGDYLSLSLQKMDGKTTIDMLKFED